MEKKFALIVALLVSLLILGNYYFFSSPISEKGRETVIVTRAIDGDTLDLEDGRRVRLVNINTPEKGEFGSDLAVGFLSELENESVELVVTGTERYGRLLGKIYFEGEYINLRIVEEGLAHYYLVQEEDISDFVDAQKKAFELEKGIWKRSEFYGCLDVEIDKYEEFVRIKDRCDVNFKGWDLKDESTNTYRFKKDIDAEFVLYSAEGSENETALYWGRGKAWNDDGDSIFIRDSNGLLVYYFNY
jgi:endonuclease YncB( thermonuclease family)